MIFEEALKILGIEEYGERIFNSNSRGELFHLQDYIMLATMLHDLPQERHEFERIEFKRWFDLIVSRAKIHWDRPESVFQFVIKLLRADIRA